MHKPLLVLFLVCIFGYASADVLCSYKGPDVSDDLMRLADFSVNGNAPLQTGDTITVKFTLQNYGQQDLQLGSKGLFAAARNPEGANADFGFSYTDSTLEYGGVRTIEVETALDKAGSWKVWPSYHLELAAAEKFGPDEWQVCELQVAEIEQDSDGDGIADEQDNCPEVANKDQLDSDKDSVGNVCDNCPNNINVNQEDSDTDGLGDACDECDDRDSDHDGIKNCLDQCPEEAETFNDYQDNDGCADEKPQNEKPTLTLNINPENPKAGEKFKVSLQATGNNIQKVAILINGAKAKECSGSFCEFEGTSNLDAPEFSGIATDLAGEIGYAGHIPFPEIPECFDSDDGSNPWLGGYATNETAVFEEGTIILPTYYYDECTDHGTLREYYCDGNAVLNRDFDCDRCSRGAAMVLPDGNSMQLEGDYCECQDSDRGRDPYTMGTANGTATDYCISMGRLNEYYCSHGRLIEEEMVCPCDSGRCTCIDSDRGRNYYTFGGISFDPLDRDDACVNSTTLREYYCNSTGDVSYEDVSCHECGSGRCLCEDSDGGINEFVRGTLTSGSTDYCFNSEMLVEYSTELTGNSCIDNWQYIDCRAGCLDGACQETCDDGLQNQGETGIDCGGPCPNECRVCISSAITYDHGTGGKFSLGDALVATTAQQAVMEYSDCLRLDWCRNALPSVTYFPDYSIVDVSYIFSSGYSLHPRHFTTADVVMEAVGYYVANHMRYMYDGDDGHAQSARETIEDSGSRSGTICLAGDEKTEDIAMFSKKCESSTHVDTCPNDYCGDCEDHAFLRMGLMRALGIKPYCVYCADHYNGYWGGGHTFNVVLYQGKWRVMDYGYLGDKFLTDWDQHKPQNIFNEERGTYWCPDWKDNLGDGHLDAGCDKTSPSSRTWNYEGGVHCPSSWSSYWSYRTDTCP